MRIAVSAGLKTSNITSALEARIKAGGDDIITLSSLDEMMEYISCGYKLDRIVIVEPAITNNGTIESEEEIRERITTVANVLGEREKGASVIFITAFDDLADIIYEESLSIRANTAIVVKGKPYSVKFFMQMATCEIGQIDKELIYTPSTNNIEEQTGKDDEWEDEEPSEEGNSTVDTWEVSTENTDWEDSTEDTWEDSTENTDWEYTPTAENISENWDDADNNSDLENSNEDWENSDTNKEDAFSEEVAQRDSNEDNTEWDDDSFDTIGEDTSDSSEDYNCNNEDSANTFRVEEEDNSIYDGSSWDNEEDMYSNEESSEYKASEIYTDKVESNIDTESIGEIYKETEQDKQEEISKEIYSKETKKTPRRSLFGSTRKQRSQSIDGIQIDIDGGITTSELAHRLESFASRGNSIIVTGNGGTGSSIVAINMANFIASIGYSTLVVDMDTQHRAQSYITKENYMATSPGSSDIMTAINSGAPAERYARVVKPGIHLLSMWVGGDCMRPEELIKRENLSRFMNSAKSRYNFIIYDIPFNSISYMKDIVYTADNIVNVADCSNWGMTKFMLDYCNVDSEQLQEVLFTKTEVVLNKVRDIDYFMGRRRPKNAEAMLEMLDEKVADLTGIDSGLYFSNMRVVGKIPFDAEFDEQWYTNKWYSDTLKGRGLFAQIVAETVLY